MPKGYPIKKDREIYKKMRFEPLFFIEKMWNIIPQPIKNEYQEEVEALIKAKDYENIKAEHFGPFLRGKHITWQQWLMILAVTNAINNKGKKRITIRSGHGIGKALSSMDVVPTLDGLKFVKDVVVDDELFGENGEPVKVKAIKNWGRVPFYKVSFDDGSFVNVSSGHLWKVKNRQDRRIDNDWKVLSTVDILKQGVKRPNGVTMARQWEIPIQGIVQYKKIDHNVDPYTYGVWLGDGHKYSSRITNFDKEVWDNIPYKLSEDRDGVKTVYGLITKLKEDNLFGCTTYTAHVNRKYIESSDRLAVLQGLLDTDGWVEKSGGAGFASASRQLTRDVIEIARSLGLKARQEKFKDNDYAGSWHTYITWDGKTELFKIKRKQQKLIFAEERYQKRWIDRIEEIEDKEGICFEVEGSLFLTKDFHVTHNSAFLAWMLIWFLFCHPDSQIPCTAPTSAQLFDILWKETAKWLRKMPDWAQAKFEWQSEYIRLIERPETWFARARTGKKENPEALAGMHADHMLYLVDEASGVPDEIFNTAEGALTSDNIIFIMISNPTRLTGYYYESHHNDKRNWQTFHFNSLDSPVVSSKYVERIADKHSTESDEYRIRVLGNFPDAELMDDKGFVPLFTEGDINFTTDAEFIGNRRMGVDCAGEGDDSSVWVIRDKFKAKIVAREQISDSKSIAQRTLTLMEHYKVDSKSIYIDNFGEGANVARDLALAGKGFYTNAVNVGEKAEDPELYLNRRAEMYMRLKEWVRTGGELVNNESWEQLYNIKWQKNLAGKVKIMSKLEMKKQGIKSPDEADALALTFIEEDDFEYNKQDETMMAGDKGWKDDFDPHSVI